LDGDDKNEPKRRQFGKFFYFFYFFVTNSFFSRKMMNNRSYRHSKFLFIFYSEFLLTFYSFLLVGTIQSQIRDDDDKQQSLPSPPPHGNKYNGYNNTKKSPRDVNNISWAAGNFLLLFVTFLFLLTNYY
jgi:hypothetical protein